MWGKPEQRPEGESCGMSESNRLRLLHSGMLLVTEYSSRQNRNIRTWCSGPNCTPPTSIFPTPPQPDGAYYLSM
ncbi:hypothetical protein CUMW_032740 [Citrus unshiu]|nr:hypothetical protein CUMW_032740 [Citrus unshiu]